MNPHHLHAIANLWSLTKIWPKLLSASQRAEEGPGDDLGTVQAWRPGSGVHGGGTDDQILDAILRNGAERPNPYGQRVQRTRSTVAWLAERLDLPVAAKAPVTAYLEAFLAALPRLRNAQALDLAMHIGDEDRRIRDLLGEPHDRKLRPGERCPRCDTAGALADRTSAPQPIIVCTATNCVRGGIPSIWTRPQLAVERGVSAAAA